MPVTTMNQAIHHAVRRDLARFDAALAAFPADDRHRAEQLRAAWANLQAELTRHHEGEDDLIWPMLEAKGIDPELLRGMESEHQDMARALAEGDAAMDALASVPSAERATQAHEVLAETRRVVVGHLDHEERDLEPAMLPHLGSEEWARVEKQLRKASPTTAGQFFAWLMDGADAETTAFVYSTIPKPVVLVLGRALGRKYHREIAPAWL